MSNKNAMEINRHGMLVPKAAQSTEARVPSPPRFKVSDGHKPQHSRNPGEHIQGGYPIQVVLQKKAENPGTPQAPKEQPASHGSLVVQPPPSLSPEDARKVSFRSTPQLQDSKDRSHLPSEAAFAVNGTDLHRRSLASAPSFLGERTYQYRPIEETSIRLVRLLPERKTMMKCEILHVSLGQPPPYVAISYTWGDTGDTRKIEIEGFSIHVAVSLHGALQALRQKQTSLLIWVDALCIDQKNRDERSQQVQLMPSIYSNAESVAIWLGPQENDSTKAVRFIEQLSAPVSQIGSTSHLLSSGAANGDLLAVVSLFGRDYWRRLWVVQEVFNAKNITVYCGPTKLPWAAYQYASATFSQRRGELIFTNKDPDTRRLAISPDQFSYVQTLIYQGPASLPDLRSYVSDGEMVLLEVLRACRRKLASDPRDKLYGILGVLPAGIRDEFRADYNLSVKDVYTEVVDFLLKTTEKLDIICEAIHFPVHTSSTNLPSFVPDWSHIPQTSAMGFKYGFSAAGSSKAVCRFCDERLNKLEISAIEIDVIRSRGVAVGTLCN